MVKQETTTWMLADSDINLWECNKCDAAWQLIDGTPLDNRMQYCLGCGREIEDIEEAGELMWTERKERKELYSALQRFIEQKHKMHIPLEQDDDDIMIADAFDELEKLREENKRLREALKERIAEADRLKNENEQLKWRLKMIIKHADYGKGGLLAFEHVREIAELALEEAGD